MSSLISALSESEQELLFEDLNYLNMAEIKSFCKTSIALLIFPKV